MMSQVLVLLRLKLLRAAFDLGLVRVSGGVLTEGWCSASMWASRDSSLGKRSAHDSQAK